jgi:HEAT repeat protein
MATQCDLPIESGISTRLRELEAVRDAVQRVAAQGKREVGDVEALALDRAAPIMSRLDAITVLTAMPQGRAEVLGALLDSDDPMLVVETLKCVRNARTARAAPEIVARMKSCNEPRKRAVLAWALAAYPKDAGAQTALLEVMARDPSQSVRDHAIESLGEFRSPAVLNALLRVLEQGSASERFWALYSLGTLADPQAREAIARCLHDQTVNPEFGTVAGEARRALEKINRRIRERPGRKAKRPGG